MLFREIRHFLQLFAEKLTQTPRHRGLLKKVAHFGQIDDFIWFFAKWGTFCNFLLKSSPKRWSVVVCSRRFYILAKSTIFHGFSKWGTFFCNFLLKSWPKRQNVAVCSRKLPILAESTIFHAFPRNEALLAEKFTQTPKHSSLLEKDLHLAQIGHFSCFFAKCSTFWHFLLKSWPKRRNMVVCSKSCKFWPNRRFLILFREIRHVLQLFAKKFTQTRRHRGLL